MVECRDDQEEDDEDEGPDGANVVEACGEEAEEADFGDVQADEELLEGARIAGTFQVNACVVYEEEVVAIGEVEEEEADGAEAGDERRDAGIADC